MLEPIFPSLVRCNLGEIVRLPVKLLGDPTETRSLNANSFGIEEIVGPDLYYETEGASMTFSSDLSGTGALLIETAQAVPGAYLLRLKVILSNSASFIRQVRLEVA